MYCIIRNEYIFVVLEDDELPPTEGKYVLQ